MKKTIQKITMLAAVCIALSTQAGNNPKDIAGSFGVCGCSGTNQNNLINLTLKNDATFSYVDNSDPVHKLQLSGTWAMKNNTILLVSSDGSKSFHRKWKYNKERTCIRSRHKLNFRRICLLNPC